jgi:hypothetical protein
MEDWCASHEALCAVAKIQNCTSSALVRTVSRHLLPETASFANIEEIKKAADLLAVQCYVGTSAKALAISAHFAPVEEEADECDRPRRKRRRNAEADDQAERVSGARKRLATGMPDLPSAELDVAELTLVRLVNQLRGSAGEACVQSYALLAKKLSVEDPRARVVIAARLNAGVAMPVRLLKACLGECWQDGLLTTLDTLHGISEVDLPYSAEAEAALSFGNSPLLLVTSVATR